MPATAFAEPDRNTSKPVVIRWFRRTDGELFFFAGIWREWGSLFCVTDFIKRRNGVHGLTAKNASNLAA